MSDTKTFLVSFICGVSCIWDHSCIRVTCFDDMPTWSVSNICLTHMRYNWFGVNYMHESWCTYIGLCSHAYVSVWISIDVVSTICTSHGAHINETCVTHHELSHSQFIWSVTQLMTQLRIDVSHAYAQSYECVVALLQNSVSFIGLFCKRDL